MIHDIKNVISDIVNCFIMSCGVISIINFFFTEEKINIVNIGIEVASIFVPLLFAITSYRSFLKNRVHDSKAVSEHSKEKQGEDNI